MTSAELYVTAAYLVFLAIVLAYVVIFSFKVAMLERDVAELTGKATIHDAAERRETAGVA